MKFYLTLFSLNVPRTKVKFRGIRPSEDIRTGGKGLSIRDLRVTLRLPNQRTSILVQLRRRL